MKTSRRKSKNTGKKMIRQEGKQTRKVLEKRGAKEKEGTIKKLKEMKKRMRKSDEENLE